VRFFHTLPAFNDPFRGFRQNIVIRFAIEKLELSIYQMVKHFENILLVSIQYTNATDRQTDGQTPHGGLGCVMRSVTGKNLRA